MPLDKGIIKGFDWEFNNSIISLGSIIFARISRMTLGITNAISRFCMFKDLVVSDIELIINFVDSH